MEMILALLRKIEFRLGGGGFRVDMRAGISCNHQHLVLCLDNYAIKNSSYLGLPKSCCFRSLSVQLPRSA